MADKRERRKFAAIIPTGYELDGKGRLRSITAQIAGDADAVRVAADLMRQTLGEENVIKLDGDTATSQTWGGVGVGKMDASRGARSKKVFVKGTGWIDVSLN